MDKEIKIKRHLKSLDLSLSIHTELLPQLKLWAQMDNGQVFASLEILGANSNGMETGVILHIFGPMNSKIS